MVDQVMTTILAAIGLFAIAKPLGTFIGKLIKELIIRWTLNKAPAHDDTKRTLR